MNTLISAKFVIFPVKSHHLQTIQKNFHIRLFEKSLLKKLKPIKRSEIARPILVQANKYMHLNFLKKGKLLDKAFNTMLSDGSWRILLTEKIQKNVVIQPQEK